jgi:predicted  nucleic acid-binding Zn-ribbon protein
MKASPSDQRSILDIARFDQQTNSLRHKAANLPELAELATTTIKSNNARDLRIAAETELNDVKRELLRAEGDVEQIVSRIARDEARLNGGSATPKELEQLQHEVGTLGARRAELEIMMRVDAINERITTLKAEEADHAAVIADLEIRKENALTVIHNDLDAIAKDRAETVQGIEKALVDLYEKIRETTGGAGAAALSAGSCMGCNLSVNAVEIKRMSDLAEDEVVRCEECRCILVRGV